MSLDSIKRFFLTPISKRLLIGFSGVTLGLVATAVGTLALLSFAGRLPIPLHALSHLKAVTFPGACVLTGGGSAITLGSIGVLICVRIISRKINSTNFYPTIESSIQQSDWDDGKRPSWAENPFAYDAKGNYIGCDLDEN